MNPHKTKEKLRKLSAEDFEILTNLIAVETARRSAPIPAMSNRTHSPREQCDSLREFFSNAARQHG